MLHPSRPGMLLPYANDPVADQADQADQAPAAVSEGCLCAQSWPAFRHWGLFDTWRRRFRTRIITPPHPFMDSSKHYLCAQFPHACFPMACVLNPALIGLPGTGDTLHLLPDTGRDSLDCM